MNGKGFPTESIAKQAALDGTTIEDESRKDLTLLRSAGYTFEAVQIAEKGWALKAVAPVKKITTTASTTETVPKLLAPSERSPDIVALPAPAAPTQESAPILAPSERSPDIVALPAPAAPTQESAPILAPLDTTVPPGESKTQPISPPHLKSVVSSPKPEKLTKLKAVKLLQSLGVSKIEASAFLAVLSDGTKTFRYDAALIKDSAVDYLRRADALGVPLRTLLYWDPQSMQSQSGRQIPKTADVQSVQVPTHETSDGEQVAKQPDGTFLAQDGTTIEDEYATPLPPVAEKQKEKFLSSDEALLFLRSLGVPPTREIPVRNAVGADPEGGFSETALRKAAEQFVGTGSVEQRIIQSMAPGDARSGQVKTFLGFLAQRLSKYIQEKDADGLISILAQAKGDNTLSKKAFEKETGVSLGETKASATAAIYAWLGMRGKGSGYRLSYAQRTAMRFFEQREKDTVPQQDEEKKLQTEQYDPRTRADPVEKPFRKPFTPEDATPVAVPEEKDAPFVSGRKVAPSVPEEPMGKDFGTARTPNVTALAPAFAKHLADPVNSFSSITEARSFASELIGSKVHPGETAAKALDEAVETGVVLAAIDVAKGAGSPVEKFTKLVNLYNRAPRVGVRTSTSVAQQAYSTPVPLAYLAARAAGITESTSVYEPTAGNGALLITANPGTVNANELNGQRATNLRTLFPGAKVSENDASAWAPSGKFDVVIANPPFGTVKNAEGTSIAARGTVRFQVDEQYETGEIDHAIAMRALETMKEGGSAVLLVGGINKTATTEKARSKAYHGKAKREFYLRLYDQYNVVEHFTVSGDMYAKQGAAWPIDVIVIHGKGKSKLKVPAANVPRIYNSYTDLTEVVEKYAEFTTQPREDSGTLAMVDEEGARRGTERGKDGTRPTGRDRTPPPAKPAKTVEVVRDGRSIEQRPTTGLPEPETREPTAGTGEGRREPRVVPDDVDIYLPPRVARKPPTKGTKSQVGYTPQSKGGAIGTLVPVNMKSSTSAALAALEGSTGDVDAYVAKELGFPLGELHTVLSAEQIDAVALALNNFKRGAGFIIGDQTGIGKGRVVASVIRYAIRNGKVPVFVTEKPTLYADMVRDLTDIGTDVKVFMTNSGTTVPLDDTGARSLKTGSKKDHDADMHEMVRKRSLGDYQAVFTTYNQMQSVKGEPTVRRDFLQHFATGGIVIYDESHNAGGVQGAAAAEEGLPRAAFARELARVANAVFFSSATYAKRPDVMDLYARTDMSMAVLKIQDLGETISKGGIPMQQVVASMLAETGQYVRRERSFEGVAYNTITAKVNRESYASFSLTLASIQDFSENHVANTVSDLHELAKEGGRSVGTSGSTGGAGVSSTSFTATMHNIINQMLLSVKAAPAAEQAIAAIKRRHKPVITVSNTMGSFIQEYAREHDIAPGDAIGISYADVLMSYLERSRMISTRRPFMAKGEKAEITRLTDRQLGQSGVKAYEFAKEAILATDVRELPVSPIDYIIERIQASGYSVGEITGRMATIKTGAGGQVYQVRSAKELNVAGRREVVTHFNSGQLDAVILNQSGATGISLHAGEKFTDQRKRVMIIAQAEANIDTHMQMLGRIHRTGQVVLPEYIQLVADIPAERRPSAVLAKKMASLNANTTASREGALTAKGVPDFMNRYGDQVAAQVMNADRALHAAIGSPLNQKRTSGLVAQDAMRKVTGRIPLLPVRQQEKIYETLETEYMEFIAQLEATGENALAAKTLDLDAKTVKKEQVVAPIGTVTSPFANGVYLETVDARHTGKPFTGAQVVEKLQAGIKTYLGIEADLGANVDTVAQDAVEVWRSSQAAQKKHDSVLQAFNVYRNGVLDDMDASSILHSVKKQRFEAMEGAWLERFGATSVGQSVVLKTRTGNLYGVVTQVKQSGKPKNPLALGSWKVTFALADAAKQVTIPLSQIHVGGDFGMAQDKDSTGDVILGHVTDVNGVPIMDAFDNMQGERREIRSIITGNILAGFDYVHGKGTITNFTDTSGTVRQGILLPRGFSSERHLQEQPVVFRSTDQVFTFLDQGGKEVTSQDGAVSLENRGYVGSGYRYAFNVVGSKSKGGKYFLDQKILAALGTDFVSVGGMMRAIIEEKEARAAADALKNVGAIFQTNVRKDIAQGIVSGTQEASKASGKRPTERPTEAESRPGSKGKPGEFGAINLGALASVFDAREATSTDPKVLAALGKIKKRKRRNPFEGAFTDIKTKVYQGLFDRFHAIKRVDEGAYISARLTTSLPGVMREVLTNGAPVWEDGIAQVKTTSKGLLTILKPVAGKLELWGGYMAGVRASRLKKEARENLFSDEDIVALVALGDAHPEFKTVAAEYAKLNKAVLDFSTQSGLIDFRERKLWENNDYVPFYRVIDGIVKASKSKQGVEGQRSGIRRLRGGEADIGNIVENIIQNHTHLIDASMKNMAMKEIVAAAGDELTPTAKGWKPVHVTAGQAASALRNTPMNTELQKFGVGVDEMTELERSQFLKLFERVAPKGPDVVSVMNRGRIEYYTVQDPLLLRSITALSTQPWGGIMVPLRSAKRLLTRGVTAVPEFMIANFVRDTGSAWIISEANMVPVLSALKGLVAAVKEGPAMRTIMAAGGSFVGGQANVFDPGAVSREAKEVMREAGLTRSILNTPAKILDMYVRMSTASENANRIAIYEATLKAENEKADRLYTEELAAGVPEPAARAMAIAIRKGAKKKAVFASKDLHDFSRRGDWAAMQFLVETVPFFNAQIQGVEKTGRAAGTNPVTFAVKGLALTAATLALLAHNEDDERYKALPEYDRDTYWHFWVTDADHEVDGDHFRLPKPFDVGILFGAIPERISQKMKTGKDKLFWQRISWLLRESMMLNPVPQLVFPVVEQAANRDFFRGKPIVGMSSGRLAPDRQFTPWTSDTMRLLGELTADTPFPASPMRAEALVRGYFGVLGSYALMVSDVAARRWASYPEKPAWSLSETPVVGRFLRSRTPKNTRYVTALYDMLKEADTLHNTILDIAASGGRERAEELEKTGRGKLVARRGLRRTATAIGRINRAMKAVYASTMTPDEKRAKLDELLQVRATIAKETDVFSRGFE